jgi:hypothetical protein
MVILIFDKTVLLSKNKFIGKQKYFFRDFFDKVLNMMGTVFLLLGHTVMTGKKNVSVLKISSRTHYNSFNQ